MTEADWLASADPEAMLRFLDGRVSDRKLRLFACACCRRIWHLLPDPRSRYAVEVAERYADGRAGLRELAATLTTALEATRPRTPGHRAAVAAYWAGNRKMAQSIWNASTAAIDAAVMAAAQDARAAGTDPLVAWNEARAAEARAQADLLREIFGDLFRPVALDPAWLAWHGGTVVRIARSVYDGRRFDELPVLADALEEAGCGSAGLLAHCRRPGGHVPGCWAVDLVLGQA